jgi:hypothetical protein
VPPDFASQLTHVKPIIGAISDRTMEIAGTIARPRRFRQRARATLSSFLLMRPRRYPHPRFHCVGSVNSRHGMTRTRFECTASS